MEVYKAAIINLSSIDDTITNIMLDTCVTKILVQDTNFPRLNLRSLEIVEGMLEISTTRLDKVFPKLTSLIIRRTKIDSDNYVSLTHIISGIPTLINVELDSVEFTKKQSSVDISLNFNTVLETMKLGFTMEKYISVVGSIPTLKQLYVRGFSVRKIVLLYTVSSLELLDLSECINLEVDRIELPYSINLSIVRWPLHIPNYPPILTDIRTDSFITEMFNVSEFRPYSIKLSTLFDKTDSIPNPICEGELRSTFQCRHKQANLFIKNDDLNMYVTYNNISWMTKKEALTAIKKDMLPSVEWCKAQYDYISALSLEDRYIIQLYTMNQNVLNSFINEAPRFIIDTATIRSFTNKRINHAYRTIFKARNIEKVTIQDVHEIQPYIVERIRNIIQDSPPLDKNIVIYRRCNATKSVYHDKSFILTSTTTYLSPDTEETRYVGDYIISVPIGTRCLLATNSLTYWYEIILQKDSKFGNISSEGYYDASSGQYNIVSRCKLIS